MADARWLSALKGPFLIAALALSAGHLAGCASSSDAAKALNPDPPGKMYAEADALQVVVQPATAYAQHARGCRLCPRVL